MPGNESILYVILLVKIEVFTKNNKDDIHFENQGIRDLFSAQHEYTVQYIYIFRNE